MAPLDACSTRVDGTRRARGRFCHPVRSGKSGYVAGVQFER